eukprot:gb/GFBE01082412.1/.p1 GENE.gb/GFBE01082412.1/~~gb/GFBE01082412.1/.p1  ORF type:complete len:862 (+),score=151.39 gb/GFBE01082412.1/:1-2586(+)
MTVARENESARDLLRSERATSDATDAAGALAKLQLFRAPRLREDWATNQASDPLSGQVTHEESLWGVIVTMGICGVRDKILVDHDLQCYVLHFFCFWGVMSTSRNYAGRFNDTDGFHKLLWAFFTLGMIGQCAFLNHSERGFAASTGFLHMLLAVAHARAAWYLPRVRFFCACYGAWSLVALAIFAVIASQEAASVDSSTVSGLLWLNAFLEPMVMVPYAFATRSKELKDKRDVPVNLTYLLRRLEGFNMMNIVCSFLFPLGLQGTHFLSSGSSAMSILLGTLYVILLKLSLVDCAEIYSCKEAIKKHALSRSRASATAYLLAFPLGMLGIAMTGLGYVAATLGNTAAFERQMLCLGPFLTWMTLTFQKSLHRASNLRMHTANLLVSTLLSFAFLLPLATELSAHGCMVVSIVLILAILCSEVAIQTITTSEVPEGWTWHTPRLIADWREIREGRASIATVSSQEHFFTVLFAVCVFQLNMDLRDNQDLEIYVLQFLIFLGILMTGKRYANRYGDEDLAHKILWSVYGFLLLLMLEGLAEHPTHTTLQGQRRLYKFAAMSVFLLFALGFKGRVLCSIPRARRFTGYFASCDLICAALICATCYMDYMSTEAMLRIVVGILMLQDWVFVIVTNFVTDKELWDVPMNIAYVVSRLNGLFMEVLGVAVLVPNAIFPGSSADHADCVFWCDVLAVLLAVALKMGYFDVDPPQFANHAVRRSRWTALSFLTVNQLSLLSLAMLGAGLPLLITSVGDGGWQARHPFAQALTCGAACMVWISLILTRLTHRPYTRLTIRYTKVVLKGGLALAMLLPLASEDVGDFSVLITVTALSTAIPIVEQVVTACAGADCFQQPSQPSACSATDA